MIAIDTELYSSPYYFLLRDKGNKYSLYFSVETTLTEARRKDEKIDFDKKHGDKVRKRLSKIAKEKRHSSDTALVTDFSNPIRVHRTCVFA